MFGLIKPAHVQMRAILPAPLARDFDDVLSSFADALPGYWAKGARERAIAIVMGEWMLGKSAAGDFALPRGGAAKVEHLIGLAERYNDSDPTGEGGTSTALARDIIRAFREAGIIPN
jgi:hypothetical protein